MYHDFCVDSYYDLMASDFLSEDEILELQSREPCTDDDYSHYLSIMNGGNVECRK